METIRAAIFDLDGTLVDSMYVWSKVDEDFLTQRGIPVTEEYTDKMRSMFLKQPQHIQRIHTVLKKALKK